MAKKVPPDVHGTARSVEHDGFGKGYFLSQMDMRWIKIVPIYSMSGVRYRPNPERIGVSQLL